MALITSARGYKCAPSSQWRNGCRDGNGKCVYPAGGSQAAGTYTGQWRRDQKKGRGNFAFENGDVYDGQVRAVAMAAMMAMMMVMVTMMAAMICLPFLTHRDGV